jgi:bifunctional non-homologous end joining protein LigD
MASLARYQQKRDFKKTPEPAGKQVQRRGALRFVIQRHEATRLHYDFRLELDGVLKSWAVPKGPSLDPSDRRLAVHVEDHPVAYGSFEGVIPDGEYGGGSVVLWDRGRWFPEGDADAGYRKGHLRFRLEGEKCRGEYSLVRMHGRRGGDAKHDNWLLIKGADDEASEDGEALVRDRPESVETGRVNAEVAEQAAPVERLGQAALPDSLAPELATLVDEVPRGDAWLHEVKYDGYRLIARVEGGDCTLWTRTGLDWSARFPWLRAALDEAPGGRHGAAGR